MKEAESARRAASIVIFAATYAVIALGRLPGFRLDRAGAAFLGAALMVAAGALTLPDAYRAIDMNTIVLLLGMMIVVANLRLSGFFRLLTGWAAARAHHPLLLLAAIVLLSGVLSAFLVNDAVCLAFTPLVLDLVLSLRRNPVPYLLAVAMAANIGGVATITGNPQNMIIGSLSGIAYGRFAAALAPVAAIGLMLTFALIALLWRREFRGTGRFATSLPPARPNPRVMGKALIVTLGLMAAFFAGVAPAKAAALAGAVLLLSRRVKIEKIYAEIDWTLLLMFAGLFVVVAGFERMVLTPSVLSAIGGLHLASQPVLSLITAVLSNIVSNVPAVLVLRPFVASLPDPRHAWLVVAMASTLAGNFTILGSVANLIVVSRARARRVEIGFGTYFLVGGPLTVLTIVAGVLLL
ncbi:MAG TPA: anion transporter [Acetobacteraceae bacterium]|nr:anion transporter [Acetobacteraceae bacterium]